MVLQYYVVENETGKQIEIDIESATNEDLLILKIGGFSMKDQELELQVAPMSNDTMEYLNVLFGVCKRFKTDYYHATPKQREFIDAVATHEYQLMKAHEKGLSRASVPPFMGMKRSERSNNMPA